jgi:predicted RNA polymerase sigma factor
MRAGRSAEATEAYAQAIALCGNDAERRHLAARRAALLD